MKNYEKIEVNGQTINAFISHLKEHTDLIKSFLEKSNITNLKPDNWYNLTDWLTAFEYLAAEVGEKTLFIIGKAILENAQFPPNLDEIHKGLSMIDVAYHMNHRCNNEVMFDQNTGTMLDGIGNYRYEKLSENAGKW